MQRHSLPTLDTPPIYPQLSNPRHTHSFPQSHTHNQPALDTHTKSLYLSIPVVNVYVTLTHQTKPSHSYLPTRLPLKGSFHSTPANWIYKLIIVIICRVWISPLCLQAFALANSILQLMYSYYSLPPPHPTIIFLPTPPLGRGELVHNNGSLNLVVNFLCFVCCPTYDLKSCTYIYIVTGEHFTQPVYISKTAVELHE